MKKILFVNGHLNSGGVEKSLVNLLNVLDYTKYDVDLLLFEGYGEYLDQIPKEVNIIACDLRNTYGSVISVIKKSLKKHDFKTIIYKVILTMCSKISLKSIKLFKLMNITDSYYDYAIAYRVGICTDYVSFCVKAQKKYMWWHHGEFDYTEEQVKNWRVSLENIDQIVCVSESSKKLITPYFPKHANRMSVIPNILDIEEIKKKSKQFNPYDVSDKKIIVSVGRLSPEKMMINAVFAMDNLVKQGYESIKWYLIGDGQERELIENEIRKRKLEKFIVCVGSQNNPYPYISNADFYVHTSYVESQGIAVLEAMALEKCGVVTRSRGVEEFIIDGENALLAEQTVESLVNKIRNLLDDLSVLDKSKKNQLTTAKLYEADKIVEKIETLIEA